MLIEGKTGELHPLAEQELPIILIKPSALIKDNFAFEALNESAIIGPFSPSRYAMSLVDIVRVTNSTGNVSLKALDGHNRIYRAADEMGDDYEMNAVDATDRVLQKIDPGSASRALTIAEYLDVIPGPTRKEHMDKRMAGHILTEWKEVASDTENYGALAALIELGFSDLKSFSPEQVSNVFEKHPYRDRLVLVARSLHKAYVTPPQVARRAFEIVKDQIEDPRVSTLLQGILTIPEVNKKIVHASKDQVDFENKRDELGETIRAAIPQLSNGNALDVFGHFLTDPAITYTQIGVGLSTQSDKSFEERYRSIKKTQTVDKITAAYMLAVGGRETTSTEDGLIANLCSTRSLSADEIRSRVGIILSTEEILQRARDYLKNHNDPILVAMIDTVLNATNGQAIGKRRKAIVTYLEGKEVTTGAPPEATTVYEASESGQLNASGIRALIDRLPSGDLDTETRGALEQLAAAVHERIDFPPDGSEQSQVVAADTTPILIGHVDSKPTIPERSAAETLPMHPMTEKISSILSRLFTKELKDRVRQQLVGGLGETDMRVVSTFLAPRLKDFLQETNLLFESPEVSYLVYAFCRRNLITQEADDQTEPTELIDLVDKRMLAGTGRITDFMENPGITREIPLIKKGNPAYGDVVELAFYSEQTSARTMTRARLKGGLGDSNTTRSFAEKFMPPKWRWLIATVRSPEEIRLLAERRNAEVNEEIQRLYENIVFPPTEANEDAK